MLQWSCGCIYLFKLVFLFSCISTQKYNCWHMAVLLLIFWGTSILFSTVAAHYYQQWTRVLISQHPCKHLLFLLFMVFLMIAILKDVRWYLIMVLICISLMISNIEHLFMYLLDICMSYLERCWFRSFAHILFELFGFFGYWDVWVFFLIYIYFGY